MFDCHVTFLAGKPCYSVKLLQSAKFCKILLLLRFELFFQLLLLYITVRKFFLLLFVFYFYKVKFFPVTRFPPYSVTRYRITLFRNTCIQVYINFVNSVVDPENKMNKRLRSSLYSTRDRKLLLVFIDSLLRDVS